MQEVARVSFGDEFDLRREILDIRPPHERAKLLGVHLREQVQGPDFRVVGLGHPGKLPFIAA